VNQRILALVAAAILLTTAGHAEVRYARFDAPSLGHAVDYAIHLPPSYAKSERRYPVLYVLHGLFESHRFWEERGLASILDGLWAKGEVGEFLVVAVDGDNSFFLDSDIGRYQALVENDLLAHVEATYRAVSSRAARALGGVSMGGYAALRIGLSDPDIFGVIATHSAMVLTRPPSLADGAGRWQMAAFTRVFGDPIDPARWAAADPLQIAERVDPQRAPALYLDCGSEDRYGLPVGHRALDQILTSRGVRHEFALHPGDHGYEYVRTVLPLSLRFVGKAFAAASEAPKR
jgi:S-formylglutathione hydrolase FrmB